TTVAGVMAATGQIRADMPSACRADARDGPGSARRAGGSAAEAAGAGHVLEPRVVALEGDRDGLGGAVSVLGHDEVRLAGARGFLLVVVLAVDEEDDVRVLLDRTGFAQVAHHRGLVGALLAATVQLRDRD